MSASNFALTVNEVRFHLSTAAVQAINWQKLEPSRVRGTALINAYKKLNHISLSASDLSGATRQELIAAGFQQVELLGYDYLYEVPTYLLSVMKGDVKLISKPLSADDKTVTKVVNDVDIPSKQSLSGWCIVGDMVDSTSNTVIDQSIARIVLLSITELENVLRDELRSMDSSLTSEQLEKLVWQECYKKIRVPGKPHIQCIYNSNKTDVKIKSMVIDFLSTRCYRIAVRENSALFEAFDKYVRAVAIYKTYYSDAPIDHLTGTLTLTESITR